MDHETHIQMRTVDELHTKNDIVNDESLTSFSLDSSSDREIFSCISTVLTSTQTRLVSRLVAGIRQVSSPEEFKMNLTATFGILAVPVFNVLTVIKPEQEEGDCQGLSLDGLVGHFLTDIFIEGWTRQGNRCVVKESSEFGSVRNRTGLKGAMVNRELDMVAFPTTIHEMTSSDVHGYGHGTLDHISYTIPMTENFLDLVCSYRFTNETEGASLMDAYLSFQPSFYIVVVSTVAIFIMTWTLCSQLASKISDKYREEISKARLSPTWIMVCAILDQDQFPNVSKVSFSVLSICFSTFFYITIDCYMMNSMSTDLVVPVEPIVVKSLQGILDRPDVQLVHFDGSDEELFLTKADPDSVLGRIWRHKTFHVKSLDEQSMMGLWEPVREGKLVGFIRNYLAMITSNVGITTTRLMGDNSIRALIIKDEEERSFTSAFMFNNRDASDDFQRYIHTRTLRLSQSSLLEWFLSVQLPRLIGNSDINIDRFTGKTLFLSDSPLPLVELHHTIEIFVICSVTMSIAFIVLIVFEMKMKFPFKQKNVLEQLETDVDIEVKGKVVIQEI